MKQHLFFTLFLFCAVSFAQAQVKLPNVSLTTVDNQTILASSLQHDGPIIVSFWATWCKPCMQELSEIANEYETWKKETNVKLIAISIDDARSSIRIPNIAKAKGWKYDMYIDANQDLMRALQVVNIPHTFILNKNGEIVYQHTSYKLGDEEEYFEILKKISEDKK